MARCDGSVQVPYRVIGRSRRDAENVILNRLRKYVSPALQDKINEAWTTLLHFQLRADVRDVPVEIWQNLAASPRLVTPLQIEELAAFTAVNSRDPAMFGTILSHRAPLIHAHFCDLLSEWETTPSRPTSILAYNLALGYRTNMEGIAAWDLAASRDENDPPTWR